ncbi:unnamed protein product [Acanthoscelides obtectus]|uniref:PXA domain-containing protein n=1 Tax=Acanthoscelides obtectus TaxID=200917 RepID=A0A9P0LKZ5_ACAOB|nr:unnamed protein product [Acanthoscelides obtectus]CAK1681549.1 Sorting nexin-13 [Acanthoscelides obtectus]
METNTAGWIGLISVLFISSFGVLWLTAAVISITLFVIGCASFLYIQQGDIGKFYSKCAGNPLTSSLLNEGGLKQVVRQLESPKTKQKCDSRVTGSELIDSSLQEILGYIIRDYVASWYRYITKDTEFTEAAVRKTAQTFAINISNRVKEVDWIPYLTQRLVDDAATHLRLYKQARTKMKLHEQEREQRMLSQREQRSPKKTVHKRNKSETDVSWSSGRQLDMKREIERCVGNSKFYSSDKSNMTLEDYFFELEQQMENNKLCRDVVCRNVSTEKEFLSELMEVLLYILLPDEDFQCKPLRFVLREICANCVILPLFNLVSDPDYINQAIIWLCLRENQLSSDVFLTTLRLSDNCDELKSTKEFTLEEINSLRSRDSGGDSDLSVKQQLSSLNYVVKLIDSKLSKMENFATSLENQDLQLDSIKKISLTLDQILKNNIALSYLIDFVSSQGKQLDLFFYLNIEAWKVSVEQQLSDIQLNKSKASAENVAVVYDNIRSTAFSIFEQYLGEKCENRVQLKSTLVQTLHFKIRNLNEVPCASWFDKVLEVVYERMETEFLPPFRKSKAYFRLLQELDLVQQTNNEEDVLSVNSNESLENNDAQQSAMTSAQHVEKFDFLTVDYNQKSVKHVRSLSDVTTFTGKAEEVCYDLLCLLVK